MRIVIDIDEEQYEFIKQSMTMDKVKDYPALLFDICQRIANSTPLIEEYKRIADKEAYDKIVHLMNHGALKDIDTGRLDGKCEDVIPLEDAIAIVDLVYNGESEK